MHFLLPDLGVLVDDDLLREYPRIGEVSVSSQESGSEKGRCRRF